MFKWLLFVLSCSILIIGGTVTGGRLAELELAKPCYVRYAPDIWDTMMRALSDKDKQDTHRLARVFATLRVTLNAGLKPCEAIRRATRRSSLDQCDLAPVPMENLLTCLRAGHRVGVAAIPRTASEESAEAANWRLLASSSASGHASEAAMTHSATGDYADPFTQSVVDHVKKQLQ